MPTAFDRVYLSGAGYFLPGDPVDNTRMDDFIAPLNRLSQRLKKRILAENGIRQRHYAIDAQGNTVTTNAALAAHAIHNCLNSAGLGLSDLSILASGAAQPSDADEGCAAGRGNAGTRGVIA
jgi:3-oxoacyl-[acyl-carrier-protein] synthase-3